MDNWFKRSFSSPIINYLGRRKCNKQFTKPPILIGGCGRSGTTLLLAILSAHPEIFAIPYETDAFTGWHQSNGSLKPRRLDRFYRAMLTHRIPGRSTRWCEKRPTNIQHLDKILMYFGAEVRFIQIVRDPRAVCTSYHPLDKHNYWISPERYIADVTAGLEYIDHPQVFTMRYEDLISNFNTQIERLATFLNLSVTTELDKWYEHATVRNNKAWERGLANLHKESLSKWQSPFHRARIVELMSDNEILKLMERLGYTKT